MIEQAWLQFSGIGPKTVEKLHSYGFFSWTDAIEKTEELPLGRKQRETLLAEIATYQEEKKQNNIAFFNQKLHASDKWRLLGDFFEEISYFDIETNGMLYGDNITVITCLHRNQLYQFTNGSNLDDFLDLLEDVRLLASFNGTSFDVPVVCQFYNIPAIPCPHIDLRWVCYHLGLRSGLKRIEKRLAIVRPKDLQGVDGTDAILLWHRWIHYQDRKSLEQLIRYCSVDSISLKVLSSKILEKYQVVVDCEPTDKLWNLL